MKEKENRQQDKEKQRNSNETSSLQFPEKQEASNNPEISRMDKREGNLEHGEIGGGLNRGTENEKE